MKTQGMNGTATSACCQAIIGTYAHTLAHTYVQQSLIDSLINVEAHVLMLYVWESFTPTWILMWSWNKNVDAGNANYRE